RRRETTGTEQQCQLGRLTLTIEPGDTELTAQRRLDGRQADDFLLLLEGFDSLFLLDAVDHPLYVTRLRPLLDEDNRHAATDIVACGPVHQLAAVAIQTDVDLRATILVIAGLGIGDLIAGDDQRALQLRWRATFLAELEGLGGRARSIRFGCQTELQVCGLAEDALGFGSILHARQFDHDTVGALALHQRLGNAQLVDPV